MKIAHLVGWLVAFAPSAFGQALAPPAGAGPDARYVNDDAGEVDAADVVDGSLTGADVSTATGVVLHTGGRVGIGTSAPAATLDVHGEIAIGGQPVIDATGLWVGPMAWPHDGGLGNVTAGPQAFVGGGQDNQALDVLGPAVHASVLGGRSNTAEEGGAVGGGYGNHASGAGAFVGGGVGNYADALSVALGGRSTSATNGAAVGGGYDNAASSWGVVGGGTDNLGYAVASYATVGGGDRNRAKSDGSTVGGGRYNRAGSALPGTAGATVSGGTGNDAPYKYATILGGGSHEVRGDYGTILGGWDNECGTFALAAGRGADASHAGAFVWADSSTGVSRSSTRDDEFNIYASGGSRFLTNRYGTVGAVLASGSGSWSSMSDREQKERIEPIDPGEVLEALARVDVATWRYLAEEDGVRHMGPVAQDFHAAFGLGVDERTIDAVDADGVILAAIQGLHALLLEREQELRALRRALRDSGASRPAPPLGAAPLSPDPFDARYVENDRGEVDTRDIADVSLLGPDVSTSSGNVTHLGDNVGFGTTKPATALDVGGNVAVGGTEVIDATGQWVGPMAWPHDGGLGNVASGTYSFVGGGSNNQATDGTGYGHTTVVGGRENVASGDYATVAGGSFGVASGDRATVGGGYGNVASGAYATVAGGQDNTAGASGATILGGRDNLISGSYATVGGGRGNEAYAPMGGGVYADYATVWRRLRELGDRHATRPIVGGLRNLCTGNAATVGGGARQPGRHELRHHLWRQREHSP